MREHSESAIDLVLLLENIEGHLQDLEVREAAERLQVSRE